MIPAASGACSDAQPMKALILSKAEAEKYVTGTGTDTEEDLDPHLNPKYTFDRFIPGGGNRFGAEAPDD